MTTETQQSEPPLIDRLRALVSAHERCNAADSALERAYANVPEEWDEPSAAAFLAGYDACAAEMIARVRHLEVQVERIDRSREQLRERVVEMESECNRLRVQVAASEIDARREVPQPVHYAEFAEYVMKNYAPGTVIGDPSWHAPKLFRAATRGLTLELEALRARRCVWTCDVIGYSEPGYANSGAPERYYLVGVPEPAQGGGDA